MARANGAEARQASVKRAEFRACAVALVSGEREHFCLYYPHLLIRPEWGDTKPYLAIHSLSTHLLRSFAPFLHVSSWHHQAVVLFLGFVHVSPPNSFKPERVVFTCIKSWKKSSVHIRWLGSSKATSGGDRWRTGTVLSSGSDPARRRPQCACNRFTWYFLHTFHLTNQRSNCVTQLKLDTGEKLSSPIFCCLCVSEASVSPDQISTFSNIYRHTSPLLTQYNI